MRIEAGLASAGRTPEQIAFLTSSLAQSWDAVDRAFASASEGKNKEAREQIQLSLQSRQAALSTTVARLLVRNSENEEQAAQRIVQIYNRVQRRVYIFLVATLLAVLLTGLSLIRWNRRLFARMAELSERRGELAQKLNQAARWILTDMRDTASSGFDDASSRRQVNIDRFADPQEESAGILHAPLHVRYGKVHGCGPVVRSHFYIGGNGDFVVCTVNAENPVHLHRGFPLR